MKLYLNVAAVLMAASPLIASVHANPVEQTSPAAGAIRLAAVAADSRATEPPRNTPSPTNPPQLRNRSHDHNTSRLASFSMHSANTDTDGDEAEPGKVTLFNAAGKAVPYKWRPTGNPNWLATTIPSTNKSGTFWKRGIHCKSCTTFDIAINADKPLLYRLENAGRYAIVSSTSNQRYEIVEID